MKKVKDTIPNELLRYAREQLNWTQEDVAQSIEAPDAKMIGKWERGVILPTAHYRQRLIALFGKSGQELGFAPRGEIPFWNVPFSRNPFFTGRENLLASLYDIFTIPTDLPIVPQALCGLGGSGKTQIAIEYAYRHQHEYHSVLWIRAETQDVLTTDMTALAALLHLPEQFATKQQETITAVKRWLKATTHWLLIVDNVESIERLSDILPSPCHGHVLITTRMQATGTLAHAWLVPEMHADEGTVLLLQRAKLLARGASLDTVAPTDFNAAQQITQTLGGLPLALEQAGAYIEETGCSPSHYLEIYRTHRTMLLQWKREEKIDHPPPVATTWLLAFESLIVKYPEAQELLSLFAFLAPDAIPEELIAQSAELLGSNLAVVAANPYKLDQAIKGLRNYSLVRRYAEVKLLAVHRLVQTVIRDNMNEAQRTLWHERVTRALNRLFPDGTYATWQHCERYLSHVLASFASLEDEKGEPLSESAQLLKRAGHYLVERARYAEAAQLLQHAQALIDALQDSHPAEVAALLHLRAFLSYRQGKYTETQPLLQHALAFCEQHLAEEDLVKAQTLLTGAELAVQQARYLQADASATKALAIFSQRLGDENAEIAMCYEVLALSRYRQGEVAEAESTLLKALSLYERLLGKEHPTVIAEKGVLAEMYRAQKNYAEAETLARHVLGWYEYRFGSNYPNTAQNQYILAQILQEQGHYEEAEYHAMRSLQACKNIWGPEHVSAAHCFSQLSTLAKRQGKREEALAFIRQAYALYEQHLGLEHPSTKNSLAQLTELAQEEAAILSIQGGRDAAK